MKIFLVFSIDNRGDDVKKWVEWAVKMEVFEVVGDPKEADVIIVVGGDGTLLHATHDHYRSNIPFLGIDRGTLGFNLNPARTFDEFLSLLNNFHQHAVVTLQLIKTEIACKNGSVITKRAFNDAYADSTSMVSGRVITRGAYSIDCSFRANGIIVATPQGSTAYTLGAGGKILPLEEKMLAITTICSQGFPIRKVSEMKQIEIFLEGREEIFVTADFQRVGNVTSFRVTPSEKKVRLVFSRESNYQIKRFHVQEEIERKGMMKNS